MNHAELQAAIVNQDNGIGPRLGWDHMHARRSWDPHARRWLTATNVPGWPDLTMWNARQHRLIFVELKIPPDKPRADQRKILNQLHNSGCEVYVWTPKELTDGTIARILARGVALPVTGHHPTEEIQTP